MLDDNMVALWDLSKSTAQPSMVMEQGTPTHQLLWPANHVDTIAILTTTEFCILTI